MNIKSQKLTAIFEAMADGVCIISQEYIIEFMNRAMVKNFGEGIGKKCYKVLENNDKICPRCKASDVFNGETLHREIHNPGTHKMFDVIETPLKIEDGAVSKLSIYRDITQTKKQDERLRASEENYRQLFEHVGCGIFISSKEGKFLDANPATLDMLGYSSKEEFLKIDIVKDLYLKPEDRQRFQKMIERDGRVINYEVEFKKKDGTPITVLLTGHVRHDEEGNIIGYEGINVDQTQRKQMEQEIREANYFLNNMIHSSPNAIMAANMKGEMLLWNHAAEEILGYKAKDVIGKLNITKIYPEGMAKKVMQLLRSPDHDRVGRLKFYPVVYMKGGGGIAEGNLSAAIIYNEKGDEIATIGIFTDLKERLEMERRLRETQEQLLQSEKLAAMGRLMSHIAHELNNPLYGIMNTLELMKTEIPPENKRRRILEMAHSEIIRLSELLHKMLTFSKPDRKEKQPVDVNMILDEILLLHEKQFSENNIRISSFFTEGLDLVFASKNQLRQVFLNMIANARDAMPDGGKLTVLTKSGMDQVLVEISDTGIGIREEDLGKIFEAFFTTKSSVKGVGLGLSVCYGFIKDHGGDIQVKSEVGSGTTFTINLPAHKETEE
jgi:two-component system NtrC family sensor kinase